jgi:CHAT domain-containing protein
MRAGSDWQSRIGVRLASLSLLVVVANAAAATSCPPRMTDRAPVFEMTFELRGNERIQRKLLLPAGKSVLLLAREQGLDVRLEVKRDGQLAAIADNPIFRSGTQRAAFQTGRRAQYSVEIVGKEYGTPQGRVELRAVVPGSAADADRCVALQRALATADAQFAAGQSVTFGNKSDAATDAARAYKDSAQGYGSVAAALAPDGPSELLAEAEHAEAAALYWGVQDWEGSCMAAERAMLSYERIGADYAGAKAKELLAAALMETAPATKVTCGVSAQLPSETRQERIRRLLASAAEFHGERGEAHDQALALNDLGLAFTMSDDYAPAMRAFEQAEQLYERTGETLKSAQVLQNIAWADFGLGRLSQALPRYSRALALVQPDQDPTLYATILNYSALANTFAGDHDTALRQLGQALALSRSAQDKWWQVTILDNIGLVYDRLGERDLALDFYNQSLTLGSAALISSGRRNTLAKMANILRARGDYAGALKARTEALTLAASPSARAMISVQLATDYRIAGNFDEAAGVLRAVFDETQSPLGDFPRAHALLQRAHLALAKGTLGPAEADYKAALSAFHALDMPEREFDASLGMARAMYRRGSSTSALQELQRTVRLAEELRQQSANPELRAKLLETSRPAFDLKIAILAARYFQASSAERRNEFARQSLQTAEQARARALADFTRLDLSASGAAPALLQQRQAIYSELSSRRQRLESVLETAAPTHPRVAAIRADIALLRQRLNDIDAQLAAASVRPAANDTSSSIDLRSIPQDAAIVEYWLGEERALAWTLTRDEVTMSDLGRSSTITDAAIGLHASLRSLGSVSKQERLQRVQRLSDAVFAPVQSRFSGKRALTIVADGALHYVPFSVLRDAQTQRFMIQDHDVALAPSARALSQPSADAQVAAATRMLLVADPVYGKDDDRIAAAKPVPKVATTQPGPAILDLLRGGTDAQTLRRLPGTAAEASAIRGLFAGNAVDTLEGIAATRERFLATDFRGYRFIHIASHARADPEIPQLSAVILSTVDPQGRAINGRVFAADLLNIRLNTELVVLSGCETALGRSVAGEGLIGLQYVMLARGAHSVLSSLWAVPDRETAQLMSQFYAGLLQQAQSPRQALSDAMRTMLASGVDPGIWSAFALTTSEPLLTY